MEKPGGREGGRMVGLKSAGNGPWVHHPKGVKDIRAETSSRDEPTSEVWEGGIRERRWTKKRYE